MITNATLHYTILRHLVDHGYAPEVWRLAQLLDADAAEVEQALYRLHDYHGVVLHPHRPAVWVIHPFATAPTNFIVKSRRGEWWGNCAWCSLGVAALLGEDVTITTSSGAHGDPVTIRIENGEVRERELLVHFPIPMREAWNNVVYTCSTMLVFRSEAEIDRWSARHNIAKGDVQPIDRVWRFAQKWYGNHLNPAWEKWTMQQARDIFREFDLTHPIWELEASASRF